MNAVLIFDVPVARLDEVRNGLKNMGYYDSWLANGQSYYLPSNSMWKPNCELSQAKSDLVSLTSARGIQLVRCIVLSVNPWQAIQGAPPPLPLPNLG
jgi:hypothetical protein